MVIGVKHFCSGSMLWTKAQAASSAGPRTRCNALPGLARSADFFQISSKDVTAALSSTDLSTKEDTQSHLRMNGSCRSPIGDLLAESRRAETAPKDVKTCKSKIPSVGWKMGFVSAFDRLISPGFSAPALGRFLSH